MAEERISIVNYDFNWVIENLTISLKKNYSESFYPLKGRIPIFDFFANQINPEFKLYFSHDLDCSGKKNVFRFYLKLPFDKLPEDFRVQYQITIHSVSNEWAETTGTKMYSDKSSLDLFTAVVYKSTLRISNQIIPFDEDHNFIVLKCHFEFSYTEPVDPKKKNSPVLNVSREKPCSLCSHYKNLYDSKEMADVAMSVGNDSLLAHKFVLVTRSPVFKAMLGHDCLESNTKTIQITNVDAYVLEIFLKYLYCGELVDISFDTVRNLYVLADKYAVGCLKEDCRDILQTEVKIGTVCALLELSHLFTDKVMQETAIDFIKQNFSEVSNTQEWIKTCKDNPELASKVLNMVTSSLGKPKS